MDGNRNHDQFGYPLSCERDADDLVVAFADIAPEVFIDPFADWTVERHRSDIRRARFAPGQLARLADGARVPNGMIFHIARCGSTLAAQMIAKIPDVTVYSEPSALNDLLFPRPGELPPSATEIRAMIGLLGNHAGGPYVIKFRSWNSLFASQIVQSLNGVPWSFLYRDPLEVAVSVLRKPPTWLRSRALDPNPFHRFIDAPRSIGHEEYVARMLGSFFSSIPVERGFHFGPIAYETLPGSAITLAENFDLIVGSQVRDAMLARACFYSKGRNAITQVFLSDDEEKRRSACPLLVGAIDEFARAPIAGLLAIAELAV